MIRSITGCIELVAEFHRAQHFGLGKLIGFRLDHHHGVLGAGDNKVKPLLGLVAQVVHVVHGRVQHIFAIDETDAGTHRSAP